MWNTVKTEITRSNRRKMDMKDKKLEKLREERRCADTTLIDSLDLDIGIENSRKKLQELRKRNGGKNRRSRKRHGKRIHKTNDRRRREKKKEQYGDFISKMGGVKRRTPQEMFNIKDRTGYQLTDSDINLCGKGQSLSQCQ